MKPHRLKPTHRGDALLLIIIIGGVVTLGYVLGLGWAGLAGVAVAIGGGAISYMRNRR
jgi:uncharacterized membrane protein